MRTCSEWKGKVNIRPLVECWRGAWWGWPGLEAVAQTGPRAWTQPASALTETLGCTDSPSAAASASASGTLSTNAYVCPLGAVGPGWPRGCTRGQVLSSAGLQPGYSEAPAPQSHSRVSPWPPSSFLFPLVSSPLPSFSRVEMRRGLGNHCSGHTVKGRVTGLRHEGGLESSKRPTAGKRSQVNPGGKGVCCPSRFLSSHHPSRRLWGPQGLARDVALEGGGPQKPPPQGYAKGPASWFGLVVAGRGGPGGSAKAEQGRLSGAPGRAGLPPCCCTQPAPLTAEFQLRRGGLSPWQFPLDASVMRREGKHRGDSGPDLG